MTTRTILSKKTITQTKRKQVDPKLERKKAIIKAYLSGSNRSQIMLAFKCDNRTITAWLRENNIQERVKITLEQRIASILKKGDYTTNYLSKRLKVNEIHLRSHISGMNFYRYKCPCGISYFYSLNKPK